MSNAFHNKGNSNLELVVDVININYNVNNNILEKSSTLSGYSYFIHLVRIYREKYKDEVESAKLLEISIKKAIETCVNENILNNFLKLNGSEVLNMLSVEFNIDDAKAVWREEAFEDGFELGIQRGVERGREEGIQQGIQQGMLIKQIEMLKEFNATEENIIKRIKKDFNISESEVKKYL